MGRGVTLLLSSASVNASSPDADPTSWEGRDYSRWASHGQCGIWAETEMPKDFQAPEASAHGAGDGEKFASAILRENTILLL